MDFGVATLPIDDIDTYERGDPLKTTDREAERALAHRDDTQRQDRST